MLRVMDLDPDADVVRVATGLESHRGLRRELNRDRCVQAENSDGLHLFVIADGMGVHPGGEVAAEIAIDTCAELLSKTAGSLEKLAREMLECANLRILTRGAHTGSLHGMRCTTTLLLIDPHGDACAAHVGDSRLYRVRPRTMEALTRDHSLMAALAHAGQIDPEQTTAYARLHELSGCLGHRRDLHIDVVPFRVERGDRFVLCSDGLWSMIHEAEIHSVVARATPEAAARELVKLARSRGGKDDISISVVAPELRLTPARRWPRLRSALHAALDSNWALVPIGVVVAGAALLLGWLGRPH